ncbi:MAG: hypothetical protein R6V47_00865 [Candidatus Delongbacteria bacterium]
MKNLIKLNLIIFVCLLIFGCVSKPKFSMEDTNTDDISETGKISEDYYVDEYGKEFYAEKLEDHYAKFRWVKNRKVPVYSDESKFADPVTYVYSKEFVELVDGRLGLELTRVRVFSKERGYVEGYVKNRFLYSKDYYSEPYELTEMEILRRREIEEKRKQREEERRQKNIEIQKQKDYNLAIASARTDNKSVMRMTYLDLSSYLSGSYTEDLVYTQNSTRTLKFTKGNISLYFSMEDGQVTGFHCVNNIDGFSKEEKNVFLFEFIGEIFYEIEDTENINKYIFTRSGRMERTEYPITLKFDNSKENPITEITVGDFTGVE